MNTISEQAQQFTHLWTQFATQMGSSGLSFDPASTPPEAARQIRNAMLQAMAQQADGMLRSPEFLEMMKQSMDAAIGFRKQMNDLLAAGHHGIQGVAREDVDSLMEAVRRMETRVLDRLEEVSTRLNEIERRLSASAPEKSVTPSGTDAPMAAMNRKSEGGNAPERDLAPVKPPTKPNKANTKKNQE